MRVCAISHTDNQNVYIFGFGNYVGEEVPPKHVLFMGQHVPRPNPKIVLDGGKVVWGCECWWGSEEKARSRFGSRKVVEIDIEAERKKHNPPTGPNTANDFEPED